MDPNQPPAFSPQPTNIDDISPPQTNYQTPMEPVQPVTTSGAPDVIATPFTPPVPTSVSFSHPSVDPTVPQPTAPTVSPVQAYAQPTTPTTVAPTTLNPSAQTPQPSISSTGAEAGGPPQATVFQNDVDQSAPAPGLFQSPNAPKKRRFGKKFLIALLLPLLLLLGGGAAAYFGYYVPNKPENVWGKSLVNAGLGYDKLTDYSSSLQQSFKGITVSGSYKAEGSLVGEGTIDSNSYNSDSTLKAGIKVAQGSLSLETRSLDVKDSNYPDLYFKISGLKSFFGGQESYYEPYISVIDGQWISIDHTYLNQQASAAGISDKRKVTAKDITDFQKAVGEVSKQWLFTDDASHQVVQIKQKLGKEKQDNRTVYHYKAEINKTNLKSYYKALRDKLKDTNVAKTYFKELGSVKDSEIDQNVDDMGQSPSFDVWVDTHTKLIHKIKFGKANEYTEISQDYQGGTTVPFGFKAYQKQGSSESTANISGKLDMSANKITLDFSIDGDGEKVTGQLSISQNTNAVKVDRPTGAKTIQEVLTKLFGSSFDNF